MQDSQRSLRVDCDVSCDELVLMTELAVTQPGVSGARMTGGGFGGCTINLVESAAVNDFRRNGAAEYFSRTNRNPEIYVSPASAGRPQIVLPPNPPPEFHPVPATEPHVAVTIHHPSA